MSMCGYGISLQVFNSIAQEWAQWTTKILSWTWKEKISYLQANMYYFGYHITTIALYWQEKSTLLMNENKRIDNPWIRIVKCVGVEAQDENMHSNTTKTNSGYSFQ